MCQFDIKRLDKIDLKKDDKIINSFYTIADLKTNALNFMIEWLKQLKFPKNNKIETISDGEWAAIIAQLAYIQCLDEEDSKKLRGLADELLNFDVIINANASVPRDKLLSIATQACILVLNLGTEWLSGWNTLENNPDAEGILVNGKVGFGVDYLAILSSTIDALEGTANGIPPMHSSLEKAQWESVLLDAYNDFKMRVESGPENEILFDKVATKNLANFFSIMTETFFVSPDRVRCAYPDVYQNLVLFYRQNPAIQQNMNTQNTYGSLFKK